MQGLYTHVEEAADAVRRAWPERPRLGIILGTGLGSLAGEIRREATLPYSEIPHFPPSTAVSHEGALVCGTLAGVPVAAMAGRLHVYEGYSLAEATLGVRVFKALGAETLIVSNAAGGLNPYYADGDVMAICDHINLMGDNPLVGEYDERLGVRFPAMADPYDEHLLEAAEHIARREGFPLHRGVYIALRGPNLETRAEYRFLRRIGGDVVGMSTVPEVLVAAHCGLRTLAFSVISNVCLPDALQPMTIDHIVDTAAEAEPKLRRVVLGLLADRLV